MGMWDLQAVEISGGFLGGLKLSFAPGLTCIIGPRGSGKSTLAEALRLCILGSGGVNPRAALLKANLSTSLVKVTAARRGDAGELEISRSYGQPATVATRNGRGLAGVDLDRGTFLPIDVYSADRIEELARETVGDRRRALLDELRTEELASVGVRLADMQRTLEANADEIRQTERHIADLTERIEELGDARARLTALPVPPGDAEGRGELQRAVTQQQANERERDAGAQAAAWLADVRTRLGQLTAGLTTRKGMPVSAESENASLMSEIATDVNAGMEAVVGTLSAAAEPLGRLQEQLESRLQALHVAHEAQRAHFATLQERNREVGAALSARAAAEQAVMNLQTAERQRDEARTRLLALHEARKGIKGKYLLERDQISLTREAVADALQQEAGARVRIRVIRSADILDYEQQLAAGLKGARVKNHDDILKCLTRLRPEQLAQIISGNQAGELHEHTDLGEERCRRILEAFRGSIDPLALEVLAIEDRIGIELNVSVEGQANFRDAADLSSGQKCTALLPLLMARRDCPLIIDQPEDNLDNHFIFETVVDSIVRTKRRRQMIFITHNANIPVLAEAEQIIVLDSDGRAGRVQRSGTLDDCRDEIIDLLEGGREAFELRRKRYER